MQGLRWSGLVLWLALGCAAGSSSASATNEMVLNPVTPAAHRMYWLGEAEYRRGHYASAAALWRHALFQLPATPASEAIGRQLRLRIAHGRLAAYESSGDRAQLEEGHAELLAYAQSLSPETVRNEDVDGIFALLLEYEERLEAPQGREAQSPSAEQDLSEPTAARTPAAPRPAKRQPSDPTVVAGVDHTRTVHVDVGAREVSKEMRDKLRSPAANANQGFVLTRPEIVQVHGPRPMVRIDSLRTPGGKRVSAAVRRGVRGLVKASRPALRDCYLAALARAGGDRDALRLRIRSGEDGSVTQVMIQGEPLVDVVGDVCTVEALAEAPPSLPATVTVDVNLLFFIEGELFVMEDGGHSIRSINDIIALSMAPSAGRPPPSVAQRGLPPISGFTSPGAVTP